MGKVSNASVNSFEVWVGVFLLLPCEHESSNKNNWQEVKKALQRRLKTEALKSLPAETKITSLEKHYYLNFCVVVMQTLPSTGRAELFSTVHVISLLAAWSRCKILYWGMPINTTQYLLSSSISGRHTTAGCSRRKNSLQPDSAAQPWHRACPGVPSDTPLEKTDFPFNNGYQTQTASWLGYRLCPLALSVLRFLSCLNLCRSVHVVHLSEIMCYLPWSIGKILFLWIHPSSK